MNLQNIIYIVYRSNLFYVTLDHGPCTLNIWFIPIYSLTVTLFKSPWRVSPTIAYGVRVPYLGSKKAYPQSKWLLIRWCSFLSGDDMDNWRDLKVKPFTKQETIRWRHRNPCALAWNLRLHVSSLRLQGQLSRFLCAWDEVNTSRSIKCDSQTSMGTFLEINSQVEEKHKNTTL